MISTLLKILLISGMMILFLGCEQRHETTPQTTTEAKKVEPKKEKKEELIATGEVHDGEALYRKNLQETCKISGFSLARKLSQEEWREAAQKGKFGETIESFCPGLTFDNLWTPDLYEYIQKYALSKAS